ncbi:hypothetical protein HHK36_009529 [Tetracentron sinense]|uniref:Uncharacterized protein n=1 Tax=Tetracentron sinense TaxID=13715 RepID=A0A835DIG9_TETSI|nr:hypothetical protein HHK36_009529 [Tetracentron sinense]
MKFSSQAQNLLSETSSSTEGFLLFKKNEGFHRKSDACDVMVSAFSRFAFTTLSDKPRNAIEASSYDYSASIEARILLFPA